MTKINEIKHGLTDKKIEDDFALDLRELKNSSLKKQQTPEGTIIVGTIAASISVTKYVSYFVQC